VGRVAAVIVAALVSLNLLPLSPWRPRSSPEVVAHGVIHHLARAADDPALVAPISTLQRKLCVFRSVDLHHRERCLALWGVAR